MGWSGDLLQTLSAVSMMQAVRDRLRRGISETAFLKQHSAPKLTLLSSKMQAVRDGLERRRAENEATLLRSAGSGEPRSPLSQSFAAFAAPEFGDRAGGQTLGGGGGGQVGGGGAAAWQEQDKQLQATG